MISEESRTIDRVKWAPWPYYDQDELGAVQKVLSSGRVNYWTGTEGREFEAEYADSLGRRHSIALANGTLALEAAMVALGIGVGDEVVTSPRTFIASAAAAVNMGAVPVLADVDSDSGNITALTVERVITPRTKAIVAVHLGGWPCEMDDLLELARAHRIYVVEDCAQAHGATFHGRPVGSLGDVAAFSFCQDKIISTGGEGGLLATDEESWWNRAWSYKDHGKDYHAVHSDEHQPGFRWLHHSFGSNWRMTEMQAAIGRLQLRKLADWIELRNRNAAVLAQFLGPLSAVRVPVPPEHSRHAYYRFYFYLNPAALKSGWARDRILAEILSEGVRCTVGSCGEIYRERAFRDAGLAPEHELPVAAELGRTSLALEVHPTLHTESLERAAELVAGVIERATR